MAPPPALAARVLVAEPSPQVVGAVRRALEGLATEVEVVGAAAAALEAVHASPPALLVAGVSAELDGEALCRAVRAADPSVAVVLVYGPDADAPDVRSGAAGAHAFLVPPLKRAPAALTLRTTLELHALRARLELLEGGAGGAGGAVGGAARSGTGPGGVPAGAPAGAQAMAAAHAADLDFLKRLMPLEVKRSRRYRYPTALLLVGLDRWGEHASGLDGPGRVRLVAEWAGLSAGVLRDIDLVVPAGEGRLLAFLPHTGREGARVVAGRLRGVVSRLSASAAGPATASVGAACYEPTQGRAQAVSFGSLMRDATEALRRAQEGGGNRTEVGPAPEPAA
jgi:PleD family two-component response regulator